MSSSRSMPSVSIPSGPRYYRGRSATLRALSVWVAANSLTITLSAAFLATLIGMAITGWLANNDELLAHGERSIGLAAYLRSGTFISAVSENWESEFLQMATYVVATAYLVQQGSAESRDPFDADERARLREPLRRRVGKLRRFVYSYSLGIALATLFLVSFAFHAQSSLLAATERARLHGEPPMRIMAHLGGAQFWFESLQNWQSEFLSTAVFVVLTITLRYKGSPASKPVNASDKQTGH